MKIMNIILGIACAVVIGLAAMFYTQKSKALRSNEEQQTKLAAVEADLGDLQAKQTALLKERDDLSAQLKEESGHARTMSADVLRYQRESAGMADSVRSLTAKLRSAESEVNQLSEARRNLITRFTEELRKRDGVGGDGPSMELSGSSLFHSGQVDLTEEGKEALRQVGEKLKDMGDKLIRVEGHTDNVPVRRQKDIYQTNWEVSMARAINVVRFLVDEVGIPPERLEAVGMSQYHPIADNSTPEGREKNRRIVIKLLPLPAGTAPVPAPAEAPAAE